MPARSSSPTIRRCACVSVVEQLFVGFAVLGVGLLGVALEERVARDLRGRMAVAVGGVFDQFLLCELKALGLTAACLVDGLTLFAPALGEVGQRVVGHLGRHARTVTA